jgi:hypothetical protein
VRVGTSVTTFLDIGKHLRFLFFLSREVAKYLSNLKHELGKITNKKFQLAKRNPNNSIPYVGPMLFLSIS